MAWIEQIDEKEADRTLRDAYAEIVRHRGRLSNIMRVHSLHPEAMTAHMNLYMQIVFAHVGLKRADRELLAVVVSASNGCDYCTRHHSEALLAYWKDRDRVRQAADDYRALALPERTRAMLDYAILLTLSPARVKEMHVERLRKAGFSDRDILDINLVTSYFNFVNRIAQGLGVELTEDEARGYRY